MTTLENYLEKFEENKKAFTDLTTQSDYTELTKELYEGSGSANAN